jgi:hypothetical protein
LRSDAASWGHTLARPLSHFADRRNLTPEERSELTWKERAKNARLTSKMLALLTDYDEGTVSRYYRDDPDAFLRGITVILAWEMLSPTRRRSLLAEMEARHAARPKVPRKTTPPKRQKAARSAG